MESSDRPLDSVLNANVRLSSLLELILAGIVYDVVKDYGLPYVL
jgi:hypothetical protein